MDAKVLIFSVVAVSLCTAIASSEKSKSKPPQITMAVMSGKGVVVQQTQPDGTVEDIGSEFAFVFGNVDQSPMYSTNVNLLDNANNAVLTKVPKQLNVAFVIANIAHERNYRAAGTVYLVAGGDILAQTPFLSKGTLPKKQTDPSCLCAVDLEASKISGGAYAVIIVATDLLSRSTDTKSFEVTVR